MDLFQRRHSDLQSQSSVTDNKKMLCSINASVSYDNRPAYTKQGQWKLYVAIVKIIVIPILCFFTPVPWDIRVSAVKKSLSAHPWSLWVHMSNLTFQIYFNIQQTNNRLFLLLIVPFCVCLFVCLALFPVFPSYHILPGRRQYHRNPASRREKRVLWLEAQSHSHLSLLFSLQHTLSHKPAAVNQGSCVMGKHTSVVWLRSLTWPAVSLLWITTKAGDSQTDGNAHFIM